MLRGGMSRRGLERADRRASRSRRTRRSRTRRASRSRRSRSTYAGRSKARPARGEQGSEEVAVPVVVHGPGKQLAPAPLPGSRHRSVHELDRLVARVRVDEPAGVGLPEEGYREGRGHVRHYGLDPDTNHSHGAIQMMRAMATQDLTLVQAKEFTFVDTSPLEPTRTATRGPRPAARSTTNHPRYDGRRAWPLRARCRARPRSNAGVYGPSPAAR